MSEPSEQVAPLRRILFVDDEPRVLLALERLLRPRRTEWEMVFANGGEEALALLGREPFDVLVSDMRMPGIDGPTLLARVRKDYPQTVRIVLTGHTDLATVLRAVPVAHQLLSKPCDGEMVKDAVERACALQNLLRDEPIRRIVGGIDSLPSLPRICLELNNLLADPDVSLTQVAKVVEKDPGMAAKVLQLVNSSFFGLARRMTNVRDAVSYLGTNVLKNLVLSLAVFRAFDKAPKLPNFSLEALQAHSFTVATVAKRLCPSRELGEDAFVSALLADVGLLVLANHIPDHLIRALDAADAKNMRLHEVEQELWGVTHAEIGAYLLGLWDLPTPIVEAVASHHDVTRIPHRQFGALDAAYIARVLVENSYHPAGVPMDRDEELDPAYLEAIGMAGRMPEWQRLVNEQVKAA